jgi:hypothetical protein
MLASHSMVGRGGNTLYALPVDQLLSALRDAGRLAT